MSLCVPRPTLAPSLPTTNRGASFPSATVVNLRMIWDNDPGAFGAAPLGGPAFCVRVVRWRKIGIVSSNEGRRWGGRGEGRKGRKRLLGKLGNDICTIQKADRFPQREGKRFQQSGSIAITCHTLRMDYQAVCRVSHKTRKHAHGISWKTITKFVHCGRIAMLYNRRSVSYAY